MKDQGIIQGCRGPSGSEGLRADRFRPRMAAEAPTQPVMQPLSPDGLPPRIGTKES